MTTTALVPPPGAAPPRSGELKARLRRARRKHRDRSIGDLLTDLYMIAFLIAIYGWAAVDSAGDFLHRQVAAAPSDPGARYWIGVGAGIALAGFVWQGLTTVGPLQVGPAVQSWLASTPLSRRALLAPRFAGLALAGSLGAAVLGAASAAVGRSGGYVWAALAGLAWGTTFAAGTVAAQAVVGRRWPARVLSGFGGLLVLGVVLAHGLWNRAPAAPGTSILPAVALAGVLPAVVLLVLAVRALPRIDRASLSTGARFASAASSAILLLDPSMLAAVVENQRWRAVGRVRSRRFWPGPRWWVLLQADLRRVGRTRASLAWWAVLVLAVYAVAVALPAVAGAVQVIAAYLAADRFAGGLRGISRSAGLRRALGGSDAELKLIHLVVPALAATLWWLATVPAVGAGPPWLAVLLVVGVTATVYRAATRGPMVYGGSVGETPMGNIPVDLIRQVVRGPDVLFVLVAAQILVR
ncbi:hypothetical protein Ais01nite_58520 [Asanoa ishikariensis]|uniref:ABC-2 type transport system permease protein n=1 Tax=Asanoa ishikariensis TaxID=137265 RepID=A0A1H3PH37_9ACTN|nr:DUF6297 family protein [Asanoa ishikariensis]GIF67817.1 hypothetical protein Ais01nite_58520 [Asanoa ishikariensis]SDZ00263.1 hypothetical protein SAMN05421684_2872 [Asanoa ishikariensis]